MGLYTKPPRVCITVGLVNDLLILNKPNSWLEDPKFWHSYVVSLVLINLKPV